MYRLNAVNKPKYRLSDEKQATSVKILGAPNILLPELTCCRVARTRWVHTGLGFTQHVQTLRARHGSCLSRSHLRVKGLDPRVGVHLRHHLVVVGAVTKAADAEVQAFVVTQFDEVIPRTPVGGPQVRRGERFVRQRPVAPLHPSRLLLHPEKVGTLERWTGNRWTTVYTSDLLSQPTKRHPS